MKKLITLLLTLLLVCGCSINVNMENTPTKQVEAYLNNYQTLDQDDYPVPFSTHTEVYGIGNATYHKIRNYVILHA